MQLDRNQHFRCLCKKQSWQICKTGAWNSVWIVGFQRGKIGTNELILQKNKQTNKKETNEIPHIF